MDGLYYAKFSTLFVPHGYSTCPAESNLHIATLYLHGSYCNFVDITAGYRNAYIHVLLTKQIVLRRRHLAFIHDPKPSKDSIYLSMLLGPCRLTRTISDCIGYTVSLVEEATVSTHLSILAVDIQLVAAVTFLSRSESLSRSYRR